MKRIVLLGIFAAVCGACSSSYEPPLTPESVAWPARAQVESLVPAFDQLARQRVEAHLVRGKLDKRLADESKRSWSARIADGIKYADLLHEVYESTGWSLEFATPNGLTTRSAGILSWLQDTERDALDNAAYHLSDIAKQRETLDNFEPQPVQFELLGDEAEQVVNWLEEQSGEIAERQIVDAVLGLGGDPLSPRLAQLAEEHRTRVAPQANAMVEAEVLIADGALRYARDMRHFNYKRVSWPDLEAAGGGKAIVYDRLETTLRALFAATDSATSAAVLEDLRPPLVQYDRLLEALERYREMTPWEQLTALDLSSPLGRQQLAARLSAEGYDTSDLEAALDTYRRVHQFLPGSRDPGVLRSLNVPLERRVRQMELTLERYRETFYRGEEDFVWVNIPDFHAEIYRGGELQKRIRVVVGNTERVCDVEKNKWRYPNATPVQWATMDHMMLNPWWNVPSRLFREEIEPHADDQTWLDAKGYEIYERNGVRMARQRPGDKNALGLVKFIFPNEHSTYMHDTPSKQYFSRPTRAYSHGCVRVENPLDLASYFMTEYDLGGQERLDKIMELGSTIEVKIPGEIPVFFEYYTVRVDDDGHTWFLADPYRLDEVRLGESDGSCLAPVVDASEETPPIDETPDALAADQMPIDSGP